MQAIIGILFFIIIGWAIVAMLPVLLPAALGYLAVGVVGIVILAALFGK